MKNPRRPKAVAMLVAAGAVMFVARAWTGSTADATEPAAPVRVTLLHVSDYHSHAVPFYAEGEQNVAGIARALAFLKAQAGRPRTLVSSGGDTMNAGSPTWSDRYRCVEWPWWNGVLGAMALGNHDLDYGWEAFEACRASTSYPVLAANFVGADGQPLLLAGGKPYQVSQVESGTAGGSPIRIGILALAGADFAQLVKPAVRPAGSRFADRVETARRLVPVLREQEKVQAVVVIGHAHTEEDVALAKAVPGIDVILGTHSHLKTTAMLIPGTATWMISPGQYLLYVSRVELDFEGGRLVGVSGLLERMGHERPEDPEVSRRVAQLQRALETEPPTAPFFRRIGTAPAELGTSGQNEGPAPLGALVSELVRSAAGAHVAILAASGFREPVPPGPILEETLRASMPYANKVLVFEVPGRRLQQILDHSVSRRGTDSFSQFAGGSHGVAGRKASDVRVRRDPSESDEGPLEPEAVYRVATTDYQGRIATGYRELFAGLTVLEPGLEVREIVRAVVMKTGRLEVVRR